MKVLVAIDSSPFAHAVITAVSERAWSQDCQFKLLTVVEPCAVWEMEQQCVKQSEIILEDRLARLKKALPDHTIVAETALGNASSVICAAAESFGADLIVLGSHGDTGIRHSRIGSVAAAIVNEAPCSVELIKVTRTAAPRQEQHAGSIA